MRRYLIWLVVLALGLTMTISIIARNPGTWSGLVSVRYPKAPWTDPVTLERWMSESGDDQLVLLDARTPEEFAVSHLRGAHRVDFRNPDLRDVQISEDATVVVYCSVGWRSAVAAERLKREGVREVYNLEGGIFDWANEGRPVHRGEERVERVHPFDRLFGLLLRKERRAKP